MRHAGAVAEQAMPSIYRAVMVVSTPVVRWWGRLEVVGQELLAPYGPTVLMVSHDSAWDPIAVGIAAGDRQIRALAKASLWNSKPMARVLDGMGQVPIERGVGDTEALRTAIEHLRAGSCLGIFPEGTVSRGRRLRYLSGAGRLALAVPGALVLGVRVTGTVDIVRFPRRPRVRVEFFAPEGGQPHPDESASELTTRVMREVRAGAAPAVPGRGRKRTKFELAAQAQDRA
jgi:1-acyl-sn-glycerol-3-phosphate acyltransferase